MGKLRGLGHDSEPYMPIVPAAGARGGGQRDRDVGPVRSVDAASRALYDGAGERRVHRHGVVAGEEETAYVDQHLVVRNGVVATKHIFAGETRLASKIDADWFQRPPVSYYHPDHLGSTQYVTDQGRRRPPENRELK
ncbi:hypothetical protein [Sorangium sp. So ce406]|uniref:hypothetical protein n=1 Tax=Sorangium sp. So ce406 TaxID=3133311 RepID=UPI003F5BF634